MKTKEEFIKEAENKHILLVNQLNNSPEFVSMYNKLTDKEKENLRKITLLGASLMVNIG